MQTKLAAVLVRSAAGEKVPVTEVCRNLEISRQTYYKYRRRFEAEGIDGLAPRSRRPHRSPGRTPEAIEDAVVRARAELAAEGWDDGAVSIRSRLLLEEVAGVPSARTVHRILVRRGLVVPQPVKRPHSSRRRFEFPATDDCWQIDAFEHALAGGSTAVVFQLLDDHSRYELASLAWPSEDGAGAWLCVTTAIERYGRPRMLLSDNSLAFSGARRGKRVTFEQNLARLGIAAITSRPYHPQTCGKTERAHQTAQRWLARHPPATSLSQLQALLDRYRTAYNHRPHQGIANATPAHRRETGRRTPPAGRPAPHQPPVIITRVKVNQRGNINTAGKLIAVGAEYTGLTLTAINTGGHLQLFYRDTLARELTIDPHRHFQPNGNPRGGTRRTRISDTMNS